MKICIFLIFISYILPMKSQNLDGKWLATKDGSTNSLPKVSILDFKNKKVHHYDFDEPYAIFSYQLKDGKLIVQGISWGKLCFINNNRFRLTVRGKTNERDTVFNFDFVRLVPTQTNLSFDEIEKLSFYLKWKNQEGKIVFSKQNSDYENVDIIPYEEVKLESIDGIYFSSIYRNGIRDAVIPIQEITENQIKLYGMPSEPYSVTSSIIN